LSLAQFQLALARLYTDERLRQDFLTAPAAAAARLNLDAKDARSFAALNTSEVRHFATCLVRKRILDARKTLPLTYRALGEEFDRLLRAELHGPPRAGRHRGDAAALTMRLAELGTRRMIEPAWIADLARYEMAFVQMDAPRPRFMLRRFSFPMGKIVAAIAAGNTRPDVAPRLAFAVWLRMSRAGPLKHRAVVTGMRPW
jgi:hypothetical protein